MKILMVLDEEFPPDVRVENEMKTLSGAGHQITLLCYTRQDKPGQDRYDEVNVTRIPISRYMYKMKALALALPFYHNFWKKHIKKALDQGHYDVMHVHDLPLLKPCLELSRERDIKLVADFHENRPEIMKMYHHVNSFPGNMLISIKQWQAYQRDFAPLADHLILVTPEAQEYYHREYGIPLEKVSVVPNYTDPERLYGLKINQGIIDKYKGKIVLSYLGNTGIRRGTRTIIEAARLLKDDPDFHFVIIGESREQAQLHKLADQYGLKNLELTGYIPFREAVSYIMASSAGLCPFLRNIHHDTTYANKMFQYMAFGKAIIASDCPSQVNILQKENCGLVFKAGDPASLAGSVKILKDSKLLKALGDNGREAVLKKYNTATGNGALARLYEKM
jgi:glycosyltransferase involved in cell wall biosynthesis